MKILKPTAYYEPEQFSSKHLNNDLEKAFVDAGFEYVLVASTPSRGVPEEIKKSYKRKLFEEKYDGKVKIYRIPIMDEKGNAIFRTFRYALLCWKQYYRCIKEKNVDVVYAASTPPIQGMMAAKIASKLKAPFVYNLQDVFPDSLVNAGMTKKGSLLWKIGRKIEDYTYKHADKIIMISDGFKENVMAKGVTEEKIEVIPNWIDADAVRPIPRSENKLIERYGLDPNKFYISYCGNIGLSQNFEMLVEVAEQLREKRDIQFVIIGDGAYKETLKNQIEERNLSNINLLPFQPYEDISDVFSLGDVGLIISKPGIGGSSVPSKALSIMAAGRPILAVFDKNSELVKMIRKSKCGVWCEPNSASAFKECCISLLLDKIDIERASQCSRETVLNKYSKTNHVQRYVAVFNGLR